MILANQTVAAQAKTEARITFVKAQIKPKFSEMTDYGFPTGSGVHEFPGGKAPASNLINRDGSFKFNKTEQILVPSEKNGFTETKTENPGDSNSAKKPKIRSPLNN